LGLAEPGKALHALATRLYPFCRSITGGGVRDTLAVVSELIPLRIHEVPTGTPVLDWVVPKEWNIRDAYVKDAQGRRVIDFRASNLHVVGYSVPVRARMSLAELRPRLYSLPDRPDWIPYRNSFYQESWGFCLSHRQLESLAEGDYEVCIDATLADGSLTYGEVTLPGAEPEEILISCHVDHPSLANDNLSGISVTAHLARYLAAVPHRYTYRVLFLPVTIGAITWLARNEGDLGRIRHGLVLSLLGDAGKTTYKRSRRGDAPVDRAAAHVLAHWGGAHEIQDFIPYGYDERQFCSPGFDLPVGCLMRTPHGRYPEYHNSGDDLDFIKPESLEDSLAKCLAILEVLEGDARYLNLNPKGEPQLGRRGLYRAMADRQDGGWSEMAMLWVLNQSDGSRSLLDIAEKSALPFAAVHKAAAALREHGLLQHAGG
jgi:aminopeptidase-like protein